MTPQAQKVLIHLQVSGSITNVEANAVHRIRSLSRRITELQACGHRIAKSMKADVTGQRYVRYSLIAQPKCLTPMQDFAAFVLRRAA